MFFFRPNHKKNLEVYYLIISSSFADFQSSVTSNNAIVVLALLIYLTPKYVLNSIINSLTFYSKISYNFNEDIRYRLFFNICYDNKLEILMFAVCLQKYFIQLIPVSKI